MGTHVSADMTAIVRLYLPEGFVIAADGRKMHSENPSLSTETAQKIIRIEEKRKQHPGSSEPSIFGDAHRFALALSSLITGKLAAVKKSGKIAEYPGSPPMSMETGETIAELFLDGFYNDKPSRAGIRFRHDKQTLLAPENLR